MKVKKAVITAAGPGQQTLPLQTLVDRDGVQKSALRILLEETFEAEIESVCLVIAPGAQDAYIKAAGNLGRSLVFIEQPAPRGYGDALYRAKAFTGGEPFLHMVSDHLYISRKPSRCARQLVEVAQAESCAVSAVQPTRENMLPFYGAVGGKGAGAQGLYEIDTVLEKPTPTEAEQRLIVPGLRSGYYLCFFGMHVLTPGIMEILPRQLEQTAGGVALSSALAELPKRERYLAYELQGRRYNLGVKLGLFSTQLALGLAGRDKEEILSQIVEVMAAQQEK